MPPGKKTKKAKKKRTASRVQAGDRIRGVVASTGGAWGADSFDLILSLRPWIDAAGSIQKKALRVVVARKTQRAMNRAMGEWRGKTVSLTVTKAWAATQNRLEGAEAKSLRSTTAGPELLATKERQATATCVKDRVLGELTLERHLGCHAGFRRTAKLEYEVLVETPDPDDEGKVGKLIDRARKLALQVEKRLPKISQAVADDLLDQCNGTWRPTEPPLSPAAFKRQLSPTSLHIAAGRVTLDLAAGDLFGDHIVEVRMSPRGKINEILIAG